jgi:hypothetical protein
LYSAFQDIRKRVRECLDKLFAKNLDPCDEETAHLAPLLGVTERGGKVLHAAHPVAVAAASIDKDFNHQCYMLCPPSVAKDAAAAIGRNVSVVHDPQASPVFTHWFTFMKRLRDFDATRDTTQETPFFRGPTDPADAYAQPVHFSDVWCHVFTAGFCCGQRMDVLLPPDSQPNCWDPVFGRRRLNEDGSESEDFIMCNELLALVDYYIMISPWASVSNPNCNRSAYVEILADYACADHLAKQAGRPSCVQACKAALQNYTQRFEDAVKKVKKRKNKGRRNVDVDLSLPADAKPKTQIERDLAETMARRFPHGLPGATAAGVPG